MVDLRLEVHDSVGAVPADAWGALTARPPASLTGSRAWVEVALETVDRGCVPYLAAFYDDARLVGLMALVRDDRGPHPVVRFAAAPSNDLVDVLALPGYGQSVAVAALGFLCNGAAGQGRVLLDDVDPDGHLAKAGRGHASLRWTRASVAPVLDLGNATVVMGARRQRRLDCSLERLRREQCVTFHRTQGSETVAGLAAFIAMRDARLVALGRRRDDPPLAFLTAVVGRLAGSGHCTFMECAVDGEVVARDLYVLDGAVAMLWLRALDMRWLRWSCGHVLLCESARRFAADGFETLDLGRGDEAYKFAFGAQSRHLLTATITNAAHVKASNG